MKYYKAGDVDLVCIKNFANGDVLSAIRNLPTIEVSEDAISRATALEIYSDLYWIDERLLIFKSELDKVYDELRNAPSVVPTTEQSSKVGEWELSSDDDGEYGICSICGNDADFTYYGEPYHFCPNCGARMKGADDE